MLLSIKFREIHLFVHCNESLVNINFYLEHSRQGQYISLI